MGKRLDRPRKNPHCRFELKRRKQSQQCPNSSIGRQVWALGQAQLVTLAEHTVPQPRGKIGPGRDTHETRAITRCLVHPGDLWDCWALATAWGPLEYTGAWLSLCQTHLGDPGQARGSHTPRQPSEPGQWGHRAHLGVDDSLLLPLRFNDVLEACRAVLHHQAEEHGGGLPATRPT